MAKGVYCEACLSRNYLNVDRCFDMFANSVDSYNFSYPVRIWALLMKKPSIVFDIKSPPYVDTSMDVISQVFIDCFSLESHKFGKDSPTHKMIFNSEMNHYKERVKQFYKVISITESQPLSLRRSLEEVNKVGVF